jgi:hypothetical protein
MKGNNGMRLGFVLPLPRFVLQPLTAVVIAAVHVYLAFGHLSHLFGGEVEWTHIWKGFGALGGAYVFAALASRGLARREGRHLHSGTRRHSDEECPKPANV